MTMLRAWIEIEPQGATYEILLDACLEHCDKALLVAPNPEVFPLSISGICLLDRLTPYLISREEGLHWPGTDSGVPATLHYFRFCPESALLLKKAVSGLYGWENPGRPEGGLPEDLCLFRTTGQPFLVSISHERTAFLDLTDIELAFIKRQLPGISFEVQAWEPLEVSSLDADRNSH